MLRQCRTVAKSMLWCNVKPVTVTTPLYHPPLCNCKANECISSILLRRVVKIVAWHSRYRPWTKKPCLYIYLHCFVWYFWFNLNLKSCTYSQFLELTEWGPWQTPSLASWDTTFHPPGTWFHPHLNSHSGSLRTNCTKNKELYHNYTTTTYNMLFVGLFNL